MLDWKKWEKSGLSIFNFILLTLVFQDSLSKLPFNPKDEFNEEDFNYLYNKGYLRKGSEKHYMTVKGTNIFLVPQTNFQKFFELFPHKVPNGKGGDRLLRASEPNSKNGNDDFIMDVAVSAGRMDPSLRINSHSIRWLPDFSISE